MTATLERLRPNGLKPAPAVVEQVVFVEPSLIESFGNRIIGERAEMVMGIINGIEGINLPQKRDIYFYHLWQEDKKTAFKKIRYFVGEVREDELERVVVRVQADNILVEKYDEFHTRYLQATEPERVPELLQYLREGLPVEDAAKEAEISIETAWEISPLRKFKDDLVLPYLEALRLRKHGLTNKEISARLPLKIGRVERIFADLILAGVIEPDSRGRARAEKYKQFCRKVKGYRNLGIPNLEIADRLHCTNGRVEIAAQALIRIGEITPYRQRRAIVRSPEDRAVLVEKIRVLRGKKLRINQITRKLGISESAVNYYVMELLGKKSISTRKWADVTKEKKDKLRKVLRRVSKGKGQTQIAVWDIAKKYLTHTDVRTITRLCDEIIIEDQIATVDILRHKRPPRV